MMLLSLRPRLVHHHTRRSSTWLNLESRLQARQLPILYDYLTPQPSHLLTTTLVDFLPFLSTNLPTRLPSKTSPFPLPITHHLVYFPTPTRPSSLLPDGTDTLHSPGHPFTRRLWAGGHIRFPRSGGPLLDGARAAIIEGIRSARISGAPGSEKAFIGIERRVTHTAEGESDHDLRTRAWADDDTDADAAILTERRDLCFLRPDHNNKNNKNIPTPRRPLTPPPNPQFIHPVHPTTALLTRYSALTYNAHAIHIDPLYTRTHYGHRALLVHGPLLLTLMLTCLRHELAQTGRVVREISYRCLSPVYVGEDIRVCGKRAKAGGGGGGAGEDWEVWVEKGGAEKGPSPLTVAVRGSVCTEYVGDGAVG